MTNSKETESQNKGKAEFNKSLQYLLMDLSVEILEEMLNICNQAATDSTQYSEPDGKDLGIIEVNSRQFSAANQLRNVVMNAMTSPLRDRDRSKD